jgi:hypothetical protein
MRQVQLGEVKRVGGWRGSPNSIAALLRCQIPIDQQPKCKRCTQLALKGQKHCVRHSGRLSRQSAAYGRGETRMLARLETAGLLPLELLALPVWRNLNGIETSKRAPQRLALVLAWDRRFTAPLHWSQVQRQAIDLAAAPGRRSTTAWWYENR